MGRNRPSRFGAWWPHHAKQHVSNLRVPSTNFRHFVFIIRVLVITIAIFSPLFRPLDSADELKENLVGLYASAAQYNMPQNWLGKLCGAIDNSGSNSSVLSKIVNGVVALDGNSSCHINSLSVKTRANQPLLLGWGWQVLIDQIYRLKLTKKIIFCCC